MSAHGLRHMWPDLHPAVRGLRVVGMVLLGVIGAGLFALAFGWLVMVLWNWLMPAIFHLGAIAYWQAFGLVILAKLLLGGIHGPRPHRGGPPHWRGSHGKGWRYGADEWRLYREFWEQEGRSAFDRFRERKEQPEPRDA